MIDLLYWLKLSGLFLIRSWRTSAVMVFMIATAVGTLIFLSALSIGVSDTMIENSTALYFGQVNARDVPGRISPETLHVEGVRQVLPRHVRAGILASPLQISGAQLVGVTPSLEMAYSGLWKKRISGEFLSDSGDGVFVGAGLARQLGVKVGDEVTFGPSGQPSKIPFYVEGIFETGLSDFDNNLVFCNISSMPDKPDTYQAAVFIQKGESPETIAQQISDAGIPRERVRTWGEVMPDLEQLVELNALCMGLVNIIVLGIVSMGVSCAFVIFIMKNIREFGVMKSMGITYGEIAGLVTCKVMLVNAFSGMMGILLGVLVIALFSRQGIDISQFTSHNQYFLISGLIYPRMTFQSLVYPPVITLIFSLLAGLWPAFIVVRQDPAQILRNI